MRTLAITALLAASALATPALAQDTQAPFTGAHVEGVIGYDNVSSGSDQSSESSSGLLYGGAIGYDYQLSGGLVLGADAELTGSTTDTRSNNLIAPGDVFKIDAGRDIYVGGKIGYAVSPAAMIYAKGGYTNARVNTHYVSGTTSVDDHSDLDGWRIGAGVQYNLTNNVYLKGEYRYSNYSKIDGYDADLDRNQVVAGLGFKF